ncbi:metallophosphoesterase family protein [Paenibacillus xanthanilyticus]|uniref:Metallophosphoesterase family protein n=1 Tax=Paenibacillus xanthanilyticus TaxID=1783531 RepID=A0ABV8K437_9BACL
MTKERTLVVSDVHGCDEELRLLLEAMSFRPERDQLILLGDYVDRGPRSKEAVAYVCQLVRQEGALALQGNHDNRFVNVVAGLASAEEKMKFWEKGGAETLSSYYGRIVAASEDEEETCCRYIREHYAEDLRFLKDLPMYYEDEAFIYVHAGLNPAYADWKLQPARDFLYIRESFYGGNARYGKTVIFGHTKTVELHGSPEVWFGPGKIGIDGGCALGYQLNGIEIAGGRVNRIWRQPRLEGP